MEVFSFQPMKVSIDQDLLHPLRCLCIASLSKHYQFDHLPVPHHLRDLLVLIWPLPFRNHLLHHKNQNRLLPLSLEAIQIINTIIHHSN